MANKNISTDTTIWHLPPSVVTTTAGRLLVEDQWKQLAVLIKKRRDGKLKFPTAGDIKILEANALARREKPSMALLDFMGTQQYTIGDLINLLIEAQLFWVADYLHDDILKLGPVPRPKEDDWEAEEKTNVNGSFTDREGNTFSAKKYNSTDTKEFSGPPVEPSTVELSKEETIHIVQPALPPRQSRSRSKPTQNGITSDSPHSHVQLRDAKKVNHIHEVRLNEHHGNEEKGGGDIGNPKTYSSSSTQEEVGRFESFQAPQQKLYEIRIGSDSNCSPELNSIHPAKDKLSSETPVIPQSDVKCDPTPVSITQTPEHPSPEPTDMKHASASPVPGQERSLIYQRHTGPVEQEDNDENQQWTFKTGQPRQLQYCTLEHISAGFNEERHENGGRLVGRGGFGQVFLGMPAEGPHLAIKRFYDNFSESSEKQFANEIKSMAKLNYQNLLPLLGYSTDGPYLCIVYPYMANGSLEDRLRRKEGTGSLTVNQRIKIARGAARGICHLHQNNLIHRDIKSANVLLDDDFVAKLGDFGLARLDPTPNDDNKTSFMTTTAIGTPAYMAPEAISRKISPKLDTYSYGVVLLELLTGLPPLDRDREDPTLVEHVMENFDDILEEVDQSAGSWPPDVTTGMYELALKCVEHTRSKRPLMTDIIEDIELWKI